MSKIRHTGLLSILALGILSLGIPAMAQTTVVVGAADPNNPNIIPFGTAGQYSQGGSAEYEQFYTGSAFTGPVSINSIAFSSGNIVGNSVEAVNYNLTVFLSSTTATAATLSSDFSSNYGTNRTRVFSGVLPTALTDTNTFDLIVPVTTPFIFDSSAASGSNLLFDVFVNSDDGTNSFEFFQGTSSSQTESVYYSDYPANANPVVQPGGLLTEFGVSPAPEPSSLAVMALGGITLAGLCVRRRRTSGI